MADRLKLARYLDGMELRRVGEQRPAGLWLTSLPLPRGAETDWRLSGRPTFAKPLGQWPGHKGASPRRVLLAGDALGQAPAQLHLGKVSSTSEAAPPLASAVVFAHADTYDFFWERHYLKVEWADRWIGLAMGMKVRGQVHWWEYARLVTLSQSADCREVEMAGVIPYDLTDAATHKSFEGKDNPYLHRHNWISGHIYARLHANGVCEVFAHHINSMFADSGCDFKDAVPVLGLRVEGAAADARAAAADLGAWDGSKTELRIGPAELDLTDAAHLATPKHPGALEEADGFLVWQPYQGVELYSGDYAKIRTGDPYLFHPQDRIWPQGMARTLRFSLSLNPQRPARVARYLAPVWWYGLCEEFVPEPILPVSTQYDIPVENARQWFRQYTIQGGFEDGEVPNQHTGDPSERHTPSVEGDLPGVFFHVAYRTGDALDYDLAMRACYCFADVFVDHSTKRVRMQDFTPPAGALPLERVHSCLAAWLETGDLYGLQTAQAVGENAYWWHKNSWPRMAVGRDAAFVHSLMLLYRYLADEHYLGLARDAIGDVIKSQWPDGTFGDQGGGAGIHGHAAYIIKPWMGWIATMGALDYLACFPDDQEVLELVRKFVEWSMTSRGPRKDGCFGWTYQYPFRAYKLPVEVPADPGKELHLFHFDYLARLFPYWSFRTGDPSYFEAFALSYQTRGPKRQGGYWEGASAFYYLPWLAAKLWNAQPLADGTLSLKPIWLGSLTPGQATIFTPQGELKVGWDAKGRLVLPPEAKVKAKARRIVAGAGAKKEK